ncbi:MAG: hypothetical protein GY862_29180 [Gammaproteobacteria bacterium]|nr:hypothetical protein [Gammaproteobacteria bacterium]
MCADLLVLLAVNSVPALPETEFDLPKISPNRASYALPPYRVSGGTT